MFHLQDRMAQKSDLPVGNFQGLWKSFDARIKAAANVEEGISAALLKFKWLGIHFYFSFSQLHFFKFSYISKKAE